MLFHHIVVENIAVMTCHSQCGMPHRLLQRERIAAAIDQKLSCKGVPECMDGGAFYSMCTIVFSDRLPQPAFGQEITELIAEQII